ncbi:unnamed protein product [Rotaria sp. Silwood1]|nr:unnamed protein product [Rotaria sp. Silwood1]
MRLSLSQTDSYKTLFSVSVHSLTTSIYKNTTVFDDRLEETLNSRGRLARLGSSGKFYCGGTLDGSKCSCCNGECGPTTGCNCSSCMLLDVQKRALPQGWLVNSDGASARCSRQMPTIFYCGRGFILDDDTSIQYCGPTNGSQCIACLRLSQQQCDRYSQIWPGHVNSSTTSIYEDITVFDDRLEKTLNSQGQYARLGSSGKFYCGGTLDGSKCSCCNGECGPTTGCNCSSCMLLDVQKRALPQGWLVNSDGASARCSRQMPTIFYCGRGFILDDNTSIQYCGPTNGPQCIACQKLNQQQYDRYKCIWTGHVNSSTTSIYEDIAVFDDRLEKTLNSQGQYARLGSSGKFYCGGTLDGSKCSCCNGECGPMDGCNCSSCMLLDVQKRALPQG